MENPNMDLHADGFDARHAEQGDGQRVSHLVVPSFGERPIHR